jgi:N-acetylglucosamine-6-phosphate deacetylase
MRLGVAAALIDGNLVAGDVSISGGVIDEIGLSPAGPAGLAVPGFIDVQINGFNGVDFTDAGPDDYERVGEELAATGVTSFQPTLIALPPDSYFRALERLRATSIRNARIIGMHLEGPFLSPVRCGAHDPENMLDPDPVLMRRFLEAGPVTHVTIAPELPGALDVIEVLVAEGVVVALGHTDADAGASHAAFDRGARSVTHIFGAQRPWKHRDPGISGAALVRNDVFITAIVDGVHLAPEAVQLAANAAGDRFVLMTDAISAAGRPDGVHHLGDRTIILSDGACRLENGTLAGSVVTMDQSVRNLIELGLDPVRAIAAATSSPAAMLRRSDLGSIRPGSVADVCVLDDSYHVTRTIFDGRVTFAL